MEPGLLEEFGSLPVSPALAASLKRAADYAQQQSHAEIALEHLLLSLVEDADALRILTASGIRTDQLNSDVANHLGHLEARLDGSGTQHPTVSDNVKGVLKGAAVAARGKRREIDGAIVLAAIVGDGKSPAAHILSSQGLTFDAAIQAIQAAPANPAPVVGPESANLQTANTPAYDAASDPFPAPSLERTASPTTNYTQARAAAQPSLGQQPPPTRQPRNPADIIAEARSKVHGAKNPGLSELSVKDVTDGPPSSTASATLDPSTETTSTQPPASAPGTEPVARPVLPNPAPRLADAPPSSGGNRPGYKLPLRPPPTDSNPLSPRPKPMPSVQPDSRRQARPAAPSGARGLSADGQRQPPELPPIPDGPSIATRPPGPPSPAGPPSPPVPSSPPDGDARQEPRFNAYPQPRLEPQQSAAPGPGPGLESGASPQTAAAPVRPTPPPGFLPADGRPLPPPAPHTDPRQLQRDQTKQQRPPGQFPPAQPQHGGHPQRPIQPGQPGSGTLPPGPAPQAHHAPVGRPSAVASIVAEPFDRDVLLDAIPERMKANVPTIIELAVSQGQLAGLADAGHSYPGIRAPDGQSGLSAISMRLRAPAGAFYIESNTPETHMLNIYGSTRGDEPVTWRWTVTPKKAGRGALQLKTTSRSMGGDGLASESSLDGEIGDVRISRRWSRVFGRFIRFLVYVGLGAALGVAAVSIPLTEGLQSLIKQTF